MVSEQRMSEVKAKAKVLPSFIENFHNFKCLNLCESFRLHCCSWIEHLPYNKIGGACYLSTQTWSIFGNVLLKNMYVILFLNE